MGREYAAQRACRSIRGQLAIFLLHSEQTTPVPSKSVKISYDHEVTNMEAGDIENENNV